MKVCQVRVILTHNAAVDLQATNFNFPISTGNGGEKNGSNCGVMEIPPVPAKKSLKLPGFSL